MSFGLHAVAAAAAAVLIAGAGAASAQPYYGYGELPPAPYQVEGGGYYGGSGCGGDRFTLLGAHAGVTVLGVDLGAGAGLSVPTGGYCGGEAQSFEPRAYAPPPPAPAAYAPPAYGYAPPAYAYQSYAAQSYGPPPMMAPPPAYPCGCEAPRW
jgi:hypothetical protein